MSLKEIHESLGDTGAYAALCERLGFSPRDCERLPQMEVARKHWAKALAWVEKGLILKPTRNWHNEDSHSLEQLKPKILRHMGRKEDALAMVWGDFEKNPNEFDYEQLMRYVPKKQKPVWQARAMAAANKADLGNFIPLCVKAMEWAAIVEFVRTAHSRKTGFLTSFASIIFGKSVRSPSYAEEAQARWKKLTS